MLCLQITTVFGEATVADADDRLVTEGRESMACSKNLPWYINSSILQSQQALL